MTLRDMMQQVGAAMVSATTATQLSEIVVNKRHIVPMWAVSQVFDRLSQDALVAIAPYLPRRLYHRIPLEYAENPVLRPLIYMRPLKELWSREQRTQSRPLYELYVNRRLATVQYSEGVAHNDWRAAVEALYHLPISKANAVLRAAMTSEAARVAVTQAFVEYQLQYVLYSASARLIVKLVETYPEAVFSSVFAHIVYRDPHYELTKCVVRLCMRDESFANVLMFSSYLARLRCQSYVLFRVPRRMRLWLAYYDYYRVNARHGGPGDVLTPEGAVLLWRDILTPQDVRKLRDMLAASKLCHQLTTTV